MYRGRVPESLEPLILERYGSGQSSDQIASWLGAEHGIQISGAAIRKRVKKNKLERREIARAVVAEKLTKTVTSDLDHLGKLLTRMRKGERKAMAAALLADAARFQGLQLQALAKRLELSGANEEDDKRLAGVVILPAEQD